jgi:hypothetical protein
MHNVAIFPGMQYAICILMHLPLLDAASDPP